MTNAQTINEYKADHAMSLLTRLRVLTPDRQLEYHETLRLAELQASKLRFILNIQQAELPTETIYEFPRLKVRTEKDLPSSGMSFWSGSQWIILVKASDSKTRQRFSLFHELKHIIDHPNKHKLHPPQLGRYNNARQEREIEQTADYFAACVLMPKLYVKRYFGQGTQQVNQLAEAFNVSPQAMQFRLNQIGLVDKPKRCSTIRPDFKKKYAHNFTRSTSYQERYVA